MTHNTEKDIHVWIVEWDQHPEAWEYNESPYQVIVGTEDYADAETKRLQAKLGGLVFTSMCEVQEINYESNCKVTDAGHHNSTKIQ